MPSGQGLTVRGPARHLRFGSYPIPDVREHLKGQVEVDETYLTITDRQNPISPLGRKSKTTKVQVVIAVEGSL
jgi:hypothetical protein